MTNVTSLLLMNHHDWEGDWSGILTCRAGRIVYHHIIVRRCYQKRGQSTFAILFLAISIVFAVSAAEWQIGGVAKTNSTDKPLTGDTAPALSVHFSNAGSRALRRSFPKTAAFDPAKPHRIEWRWRFDGKPSDFGNSFNDRINFFAADQPQGGSNASSSWIIGLASASEPGREVHEGKWFFFDRQDDGDFKKENMISTGLTLAPGTVYSFSVTVDPAGGVYSATINDGTRSFTETGLRFRNDRKGAHPVFHFGGSASNAGDDHTFSLGEIRITPLGGDATIAAKQPREAKLPKPAAPAFKETAPSLLSGPVQVQIFEDLAKGAELHFENARAVTEYREPAMAFTRLPVKYSPNALALDRSSPFLLLARTELTRPAGEYKLRLRARGAAHLFVGDKLVLTTKPQKTASDGHEDVPEPVKPDVAGLHLAHYSHQEVTVTLKLDGSSRTVTLVALIGGKGLVPAPGELSVAIGKPGEMPRLLGAPDAPLLNDEAWENFARVQVERHSLADIHRRREVSTAVTAAWKRYHAQVREHTRGLPPIPLPPAVAGLPEFNAIDRLLNVRLAAAKAAPAAITADLEFLRRLSLDTIGLVPTPDEIRSFLAVPPVLRRERAITRLLAHPGWADHWVSYWQDALAENPGIVKADLNNSGPFRWWLHQSFSDGIPFDRLVAELVQMEGSLVQGAPAAFRMASLNDAPMAAKADILAQAFLGEKLSCARCHDAPDHPHKQGDTFSLAAMLEGKSLKLPSSSTVPVVEGFRKPKITITLKPGESLDPHWPFAQHAKPTQLAALVPISTTAPATRSEAARLFVTPDNARFAKVVVNRVWKRYFGGGFVEPAEDWNNARVSNPELLDWLAREFTASGYDLKALAKLIFSSHAYQRRPVDVSWADTRAEDRLFNGPARRRLSAEQLVDSLFLIAGKEFDCEELNTNPAGNRPLDTFLNLGAPRRAWEFAATMNERDRPSLAKPVVQSIVDVLTTYGWRQSRQNPVTTRADAPSPMQTLLLANGVVGTRIARLSDDSAFTEMALQEQPLEKLVAETFLRVLGRPPSVVETETAAAYLKSSHATRAIGGVVKQTKKLRPDDRIGWANHLSTEANAIRMEEEQRLRMGDEPTKRLRPEFRERYEDFLWSLLNTPEFILLP